MPKKKKEITKVFCFEPNGKNDELRKFFLSIGLRLDEKPGPYPQLIANDKVVGWLPWPGKIEIDTIFVESKIDMEELIKRHCEESIPEQKEPDVDR